MQEDAPDYQNFVPVKTIDNAALVPLARSLLDSADIRYFIRNERVQDLFGWGRLGPGYNVVTGAPLVTVEPSRAEEARELLANLGDPTAEAVDIQDAWREPAPVDDGESAHPIGVSGKGRSRWALWIAIALGLAVLWIGWDRLMPEVRGLIEGTTDVVLESDVGSALRQELELGKARLAHALDVRGVSPGSIDATAETAIEIVSIRAADTTTIEKVLAELFPNWSRQALGSDSWRVEMTPDVKQAVIRSALDDAETDLRERLGASLENLEESSSGQLRLHVQVPGVRDPAGVRSLFEPPTMLEIKRVHYPPGAQSPTAWYPPQTAEATVALFGGRLPANVELIVQTQDGVDFYWPLSTISVVVGRDLVNAALATNSWGDPAISFLLSREAGERLESATSKMLGQKMALVLRSAEGSRVISVPTIQSAIRDTGIVEGGFTAESARRLAAQLKSGSRSLFLTPVEVTASR